jgi:hypothetical protein
MPLHQKPEPLLAAVGRFNFCNRQPSVQFPGDLMDFLSQSTLYRIRESFSASNAAYVGRIDSEFLCDSYIKPAIQGLR